MNNRYLMRASAVWLVFCSVGVFCIGAEVVYFGFSDTGQSKAMTHWGADTAWPSEDNMRQCIQHMGADEIDVIRLNFYTDEALVDGQIGPDSQERIDTQLSIAALAGDKPLALTPSSGEETDAWYLNGEDEVYVDRWVQLLEATQTYIGRSIAEVEPFNEPDYWDGQGTPENLYDILVALQSSSHFQGTKLVAASTLNSDNAQSWYDQVAGPTTHGSTHQLAGSADSYVNFIQHVAANGDSAYNPELHSIAEVLYGCEYGLSGGIWWADTLLPRGLLVQSCQGQRLGYAEERSTFSAAAVYRAPDDEVYGFAGSFERQGDRIYYRFSCTDQDVYYNGIGPVREFMLETYADAVGGYVDIDSSPRALPVLDGHRWKIVNRQSGHVLEVADSGTAEGDNVQTAADTDSVNQQWDIVRNRAGYYELFNANSGITAEVGNWATWDGANVWQYGTGNILLSQWWIEEADAGYFYIRNAYSHKYLDGDLGSDNVIQWTGNGGTQQQWQFVLADPAVSETLTAYYAFEDDCLDGAGSNDGTATGSPAYAAGMVGQAIDLDGADDYVTLPSGIASGEDLTVAAWVYWNGGDAWQRIFDFGNDTDAYLFLTPSSGTGTLRFAITVGSYQDEQMLETDALASGQWVHVAVTLDGNTGILYLDGIAQVAGRIVLNPSDIASVYNYIGKSQWADPLFNGRIDEFRIYDYALSADEITALSQPPAFVSSAVDNEDAIERQSYAGQSLGDYLDQPQTTQALTFSRDSGPAWLTVAGDGTLAGTPGDSHVGENVFVVRVEDPMGQFDTTQMTIEVLNVYSGVRGLTDLAGLAAQWLESGCQDIPACDGADLTGDGAVDGEDFNILSSNWRLEE